MVSLFLYNLTSQIYIIDVLNPHMITPDATTQTQIIHSSDGWSSEIKSLFIYFMTEFFVGYSFTTVYFPSWKSTEIL